MKRLFTFFFALFFIASFSSQTFSQNYSEKEVKKIIEKYQNGINLNMKEQDIFDNLDPSLYSTPNGNRDVKVRNYIDAPKNTKGVIDESFETWPPTGWTLDPSSGDGTWVRDDGSSHGPGSSNIYDGSYAAMFNNFDYSDGTTGSIITPQFDVSSYSNPQVSFYWWNNDGSSSPATLTIYTSTDGTNYDEIETIDTYGSGTTTWVHYTHSIGTNVKYIKITATSDYGYKNTFIDKFEVYEGPTSPVFSVDPSDKDYGTVNLGESSTEQTFTVTNTGVGTLTISSAPTITGTNTGDFLITTDNNTYPVNLSASESATWGVTFSPQAEGARSANLTFTDNTKATHDVPLSGTGHNATLTPPFTEDFSASSFPPTDWSLGKGLLADPSTITETSYGWTDDDYRNDTGDQNGKSAKINIWGDSKKDWLFTPPVDLGDGTTHYQLEFDLALTDYGNSNPPDPAVGDDDKFAVIISTDNGVTWSSANALQIWDNTTSPSLADVPTTGQHITLDLSSYSGTVKFGFYGESTVDNADMDLFVDNVQVREIPTSPIFSISPDSVNFGTVFLGESSTEQTFTVTNTGPGTLTISTSPTITGTNTADFSITTDNNSYPVNLANGESATWGVTFTPQAEGSRSANLTFEDNTKATHNVPLTGTGHNATITSYPYNEPFTSFTVSDNATGFADDWTTSPSNTSSAYRWNPNKGGTPSSSTGPTVDHTSGDANGIYLFTEASQGSLDDSAFVYSPPFDLSSLTNPAVKFYYHMYGDDMGTLNLDISTDGGSSWTNLFFKTGQQQTSSSDAWLPFYTELSAYAGKTVKFRFKAKRGNGYKGDMAIDDFYVGEKINKSINSITISQASTSNALVGSSNNEILKLVFDVEEGSGTLPLNSIQVVGLNQNDADIATNGVKLYRTSSETFGTDNLMASGSFAKGSVTFSGLNYDLQVGNNYFWIAFDISSSATVGDTVDAKIPANGIDVNGTTYNSDEENPTGTRTISGIALSSVTVTQATTSDIDLNGTLTDNEILRIFLNTELSTTSGGVSVDFTNLTLTTVNTDDNDVSAVKLYKTSTSTFGTDNLVATGTIGKGSVTFNLSESLTDDAYYWIAYDISSNAIADHTVDAKIPANGMTIAGNTYNSSEDDPEGSRTLRQYNSGGGTAYGGYFWSNSTSNSQNNNPPVFSWIDPVAEGHTEITDWTDDGTNGGDDSYLKTAIPFTFTFFGKDYDTLFIQTNGALSFAPESVIGYSEAGSASIPSTSAPNNMIAGCLMDLENGTDGKVYYGTSGGNFVVTWWHYHDYGDVNEYITFQIILKQNGNIKMQYKYSESALEAGITSSTILGDALIGIEDSTGTHGIQYRNNGIGGPIFDFNGKAGDLAVEYGQNENALPVELTNFTAIPNKDGEVEIKWETATEINTAMFEIERSIVSDKPDEEQTWVTIGNVKASGTSNSPKEYGIKDELSRSGKYAYRLKIVDMDGNFEYSNIVEVTANIVLKYELSQNYPNPFNPTTTIKFSIKNSGKVKLAVYNALGQQVALLLNQEMEAGKYKVKFNASNLASGVYFYRIQSGKFTAVKKMLLLK